MTDEISDGIWVVRIWREADDRSGLRARITSTVGQVSGESVSEERTWGVTSVDQIEIALHEFLQSVVAHWPEQESSGFTTRTRDDR